MTSPSSHSTGYPTTTTDSNQSRAHPCTEQNFTLGYDRIENFARHPKWANLVERIYLFTCSPANSLHREHDAKLIRSDGTAMNDAMLRKLHEQYEFLGDESASDSASIRRFSTDAGPGLRDTARAIVIDIMDLLERKAG